MKSITVICDSTLVDKENANIKKNNDCDKVGEINKKHKILDKDENFSTPVKTEKDDSPEEEDQLEIIHEKNINSFSGNIANGNEIDSKKRNEVNVLNENMDLIKNGLERDVISNSPDTEMSDNSYVEEEVKILYNNSEEIKLTGEKTPKVFAQKGKNDQSNSMKENSSKLDKKMESIESMQCKCTENDFPGESLLKKALQVAEENKENELKEAELNKCGGNMKKDSELDLWTEDCQIVGESEKTEEKDTSEKNKTAVKEISSSSSPGIIKLRDIIPSKKRLIKKVEEFNKEQGDTGSIVVESDENEEVMECDTEGMNASCDGEVKAENRKQKPKISMTITENENKNYSVEHLKIISTYARKRPNGAVVDSVGGKKKKAIEAEEGEILLTEKTESTNDSSNNTAPNSNLLPKEESKSCQGEQEPDSKDERPEGENGKTDATTASSSFLADLRGTLKSLTRSDLEELIVQKLCEVITEKSTIGELRRKAQTMEQELEKWKVKAQSLGKQMREMEMVMKKYMNEVQKQLKDGNGQVVMPLRVTRSVGLQVSFYSSGNKSQKGQNAANSPAQSAGRGPKPSPSKILPLQNSPLASNTRNKVIATCPKPGPASQKQKRSSIQKPDASNATLLRSTMQQKSVSNNARLVTNEVQRSSLKSQSYQNQQSPQLIQPQQLQTTPQLQVPQQQHQKQQFNQQSLVHQHLQQPQQQQQQQQQQPPPPQFQNSSKIIDLTDDDDKQSPPVVKPSGPIRVINHASQPQISQQGDNRLSTYILPPSATISPSNQSRQVVIPPSSLPQPNRNLMPLPPLLYKGGNPAAPGPQSPVINQTNSRVLYTKALKHPAPLPPQPINQCNKPNLKLMPPRPALKISKVQTGIVLSWNMSLSPEHAPISSYQLYAYQESNSPPATSLWKKVGDVKALPLPMACTLTQFMSGHKYHFAVRAVDLHSRTGPFSFPGTIVLVK